ncbi:lytic transglycosylase domain-containing protein [bacterium]|nr:MAG: lytic transglycosylase domain-containing protein [bacterium]
MTGMHPSEKSSLNTKKYTHLSVYVFLFTVFLTIICSPVIYAQPQQSRKKVNLLNDYLKRHSTEVPPKKTQERLKDYEQFIKYFSSLSFSRAGYKVNGNFLRALISAESAADPYAVSNKNAIGLTQITIETGRIAAKELYNTKFDFKFVDENKLKDLNENDLFDPAINILICCYLVDKYNANYNGNLALIISAWNAGPGSITQYKGYPPYDETLTLIARVNSYLKYYMKYFI